MKESQFIKSIQNQAWALHPAKLEELSLAIDRRLAGERLEAYPTAGGKSGARAGESYKVRDGVAILPVFGILDKRMNMFMQFSGGTSTQLLIRDFQAALNDSAVEAILLDVDSPGGAVDGTKELADLILSAREQKPVVAYANGLMASAAYWIGSAALAIVAPETAEIGSIGVALMHYDYSAADEMEGIKRTVITGGKYKRIASDEKPLSKEGRDYLQAMVDEYYALFLEAVARQRGIDPETVHERMGDGRIFLGRKALKAGLIDKLGNFNTALALAREKGGRMDLQTLQEKHPDLFAQVKGMGKEEATWDEALARNPEGVEQLRAEGEKRERERVIDILDFRGPEPVKFRLIRDGIPPGEALLALNLSLAEEVDKARSLAGLAEAAPPALGQVVENMTTVAEDAPLEEQARSCWDKDAAIRKEFKNFETYLAYFRAESEGRAKIRQK